MTQEVDLLNARGDDVKVTMLGPDSALVTGRFVGRYRYKGKEEDFTERYTSVWVRKDRQWRVRHEHASLVPKPQPRVTG
jgi:ketosteroid isomerase-like protein